jgi:hypothetical protein
MIRTKLFLACALAFAVSLVGTPASAQEPTNQITYFTFSAPFELPGGKTLPAGKYVFKILDSPSNRHVVQIMSEDQTQMHATVMAIPAQRMEPANEPEVRFMEAEASAAPAVRTWWYPGRTIGHEFIYPKDQARRLAARQSEGVLTVAGDATGEDGMKTADLARIDPNGQESPWKADTMTAENTTQPDQTEKPAETANTTSAQTTSPAAGTQATTPSSTAAQSGTSQSATRSAQTDRTAQSGAPSTGTRPATGATAQDRAERTELPQTAGPLPLVALLGLGSLLGAGLLRFRR